MPSPYHAGDVKSIPSGDAALAPAVVAVRHATAVLAGLIVVSAVAFSFRFQSFLHAKDLVWALGAPVVVLVGWCGLRSFEGLRAFAPLWVYTSLAFIVHVLVSPAQLPEESVEAVARMGMMLAIASLFFHLSAELRLRVLLEIAFLASAIAVAILAIVQFMGAAAWLFPDFPHYDQRAYSVFGNQDLLGGYMSLASVALVMRASATRRAGLARALAFGLVVCALLLSGSRSAWLAAAAGVLVLVWQGEHRRAVLRMAIMVGLPVAVAVAIVAPEATVHRALNVFGTEDEGAWLRLWIWDGAMRMTTERPLFGVGPGNFAYWSPQYLGGALHDHPWHHHNEVHTLHAESEPIGVAAEMGLVGLALAFWQLAKLRRYRGVAWAPLVALSMFALLNSIQHSIPHMLWGLFLAATMLRDTSAAPSTNRAAPFVHGVLCIVTGALVTFCIAIPSALYRDAERSTIADPTIYRRAIDYPWRNHEAEFSLGMALLDRGDNDGARVYLERASRGVDTGALHLALAVLAWERHDFQECRVRAALCLWRWPDNVDAWRLRVLSAEPGELARLRARAARWLSREDQEEIFGDDRSSRALTECLKSPATATSSHPEQVKDLASIADPYPIPDASQAQHDPLLEVLRPIVKLGAR